MRKMATVRRIDEIRAIPNADAIECAVLGGWTVVVKKGEYTPGDLAVYCEIDSWIPTTIAPFLTKPDQEPKEYEGVKGERLRTVKLRGQLSQGLLLSLNDVWKDWLPENITKHVKEGDDVTESLNIVKYEPPIPAELAGEIKGNFPGIIPKTDQERIQNLAVELNAWRDEGDFWEVTEKLDGTSMTAYNIEGEFGVCSRNLDLKRSETNSLWKAAANQKLESILNSCYTDIAIQGELIGEGIQGNPYKIKGQKFFLFDVYLITKGRYMTPKERQDFAKERDISHVPIMDTGGLLMDDLTKILLGAEGKSDLNHQTEREGLVFKRYDGNVSFKAISNKFLIKTGG